MTCWLYEEDAQSSSGASGGLPPPPLASSEGRPLPRILAKGSTAHKGSDSDFGFHELSELSSRAGVAFTSHGADQENW
eukprot:CAMPEP_0176169834 /NCGR_PEP_ID=MMETSP0120_2-20121206/86943_2 /TAXON_ID=160619 /ORGANISM="Kryptoperidinium foliaceum, Strain CCMP 1326" /LENGTH=77 /DNA_ID=CAMNT_0017507619 /DNA_START=261 /DNA_END=491 /DNA_ORIENTATION=-